LEHSRLASLSRILLFLLTVQSAKSGDADPSTPDPFLDNLPTVEAASLHAQTLDDAPADVTIITRAQIRTYGYRTFGEALSSVRGFYMSSDQMYSYAGVRGFSLPGDFNTRFLVMINGHPMTENIYSSNGFFEQDFGLDMDLVEKIEIVRGPSSALYGSNGIFATINVITISPVDFGPAYASTETGSFGEKKAMLGGSYYLGNGANLLLSASVFNDVGRNFFFPELDTAEFGYGHAIGMDGERGYHTFANLVWRNWNITAYFNARDKSVPIAYDYSANSLFARASHVDDSRNFVNAAYTRTLGPGNLRWQISYDNYRYKDRFDFITDPTDPEVNLLDRRSYADGDWLTSRLTYQFHAGVFGDLTAGAEASADLRNLQYDLEISPEPQQLLSISRPERGGAVYLQEEKRLSAHWEIDLGARLDYTKYYGFFLSPRLALTYTPSQRTVYKFIYGRPFRNPNAYEQFYYDNIAFIQAAPLKPETANTFEISLQHHFSKRISGTVDVYDYRLRNLIQAVYLGDQGASQFANVAGALSRGVEFELGGKPRPWFEMSGSFAWQKANQQGSPTPFANSPAMISKFRLAVPAGRRITFGGGLESLSSRLSYGGDHLRHVLLADLTLTARRVLAAFDLQFGVRNALNWSYMDPTGLSLDDIQADPRSIFVKLIWSPAK
jgi:outer membrane receptor for ferrienterochelin and colicins